MFHYNEQELLNCLVGCLAVRTTFSSPLTWGLGAPHRARILDRVSSDDKMMRHKMTNV